MIDVGGAGQRLLKPDLRQIPQKLPVLLRVARAGAVPLRQMPELYVQNGGLQSVEPRISAFFHVLILSLLSVVPEDAQAFRKVFPVRDDGTSVAISTQVFGGIETEAT